MFINVPINIARNVAYLDMSLPSSPTCVPPSHPNIITLTYWGFDRVTIIHVEPWLDRQVVYWHFSRALLISLFSTSGHMALFWLKHQRLWSDWSLLAFSVQNPLKWSHHGSESYVETSQTCHLRNQMWLEYFWARHLEVRVKMWN